MDTDVALLMRSVGSDLALHGGGTTTLGVLNRVLLASLAGNGMMALLAIVVAIDEVHISILVDGHLQLVDGERLGFTTAGQRGTGRLGRSSLDTLVLDFVTGEFRTSHREFLGAATEATAGHALHLEASIIGDGTFGHLGGLEVETRLLLVGTLVACTRAGGQFLAIAPVCLLNGLAPDTPGSTFWDNLRLQPAEQPRGPPKEKRTNASLKSSIKGILISFLFLYTENDKR